MLCLKLYDQVEWDFDFKLGLKGLIPSCIKKQLIYF